MIPRYYAFTFYPEISEPNLGLDILNFSNRTRILVGKSGANFVLIVPLTAAPFRGRLSQGWGKLQY